MLRSAAGTDLEHDDRFGFQLGCPGTLGLAIHPVTLRKGAWPVTDETSLAGLTVVGTASNCSLPRRSRSHH